MTMDETIQELGMIIQGYGGYYSWENRQDTMDVFTAYFDGRFKKRQDLFTDFRNQVGEDNEDLFKVCGNILDWIKNILQHVHFEPEKIAPFMEECRFDQKNVLEDLVKLDFEIYRSEDHFSKFTEVMTGASNEEFKEAEALIEAIFSLLKERTKRINILNRVAFRLHALTEHLCDEIKKQSFTDQSLPIIEELLSDYPGRIETIEKPLSCLANYRSFFQNYSEPNKVLQKHDVYVTYLKIYPWLLERSAELQEQLSFSDEEEHGQKLLDSLQKSTETVPEFEKLEKSLEEAFLQAKDKEALMKEARRE